jgi:hypothetical protein
MFVFQSNKELKEGMAELDSKLTNKMNTMETTIVMKVGLTNFIPYFQMIASDGNSDFDVPITGGRIYCKF